MPRRRSLVSALFVAAVSIVALVLAGCGGTGHRHHHPDGAPSATPAAAAAADALRVAATDLRLGDASVGSSRSRVRQLPVGRRRVDPSTLGPGTVDRDGVGAGATCPDQDLMPSGDNLAAVVASTLCLLNGERADAGLPPLGTDAKLAAAALEHSRDMVARQYFDHVALDGRDVLARIKATGYIPADRRWTIGENLAWGTGTLATPRNIVSAWMHSEGHRENILRPVFNQIGFGVITGNPRSTDGAGATYSTEFGSLGTTAPATQNVAVTTTTTAAAAAPASGAKKKPSAAKRKHARKAAAKRRRARARAARARAARRHARRLHAKATRAARASAAS
jgi:uncharacterized protein YkwD